MGYRDWNKITGLLGTLHERLAQSIRKKPYFCIHVLHNLLFMYKSAMELFRHPLTLAKVLFLMLPTQSLPMHSYTTYT